MGENAHALQAACLTHGGVVADDRAEHRHARQVAAHHKEGTNKHGNGGLGEEENHVAHHEAENGNQTGVRKALLIIHATPQRRHHRGEDDGRCHDQHVVGHLQRHLIVDNEVGHEDLNGDVENNEGQQCQIEGGIALHRLGAETVENALPIGVGHLLHRGLFDNEEAQNAHHRHHRTDNGEDGAPTGGLLQVEEHKAAEHHQDTHQRHHGVDTLCRAAIGGVGGVGEPCVKGGIVGAGAKEGHNAVENDGEAHPQCGGGDHHRGVLGQNIFAEEDKAENRKTPQDIAHADKELPLANLVRQGAHQNGGQRSSDGGGHDHVGDIGGAGVEHLVDKDIEIHIFNDPCHLSHEAENGQRQPKPPAQFGFLHCACVVHGITSFVGIIAGIETDCNKNSPPRIRRGVSSYRFKILNRSLSP